MPGPLQTAFRKRLRKAHGGSYLSIKEEPPVRPNTPRLGADPYAKPKPPIKKHDTPRSPHKEHDPRYRQGAGVAVHGGKFRQASVEDGVKALRRAYKENPRAWNLTPHTGKSLKGSRIFLAHNGKAGFIISPEGDLQNVFNNSGIKGMGAAAVKRAIDEGARTLDAYDGFLPKFYERFGFRETGRAKFDPKLAPPNLPADVAARKPDVVFMEYRSETRKMIRAMPAVDRIINKLESSQIDRAMGDIIRKLEGDLLWILDKQVTCKGYDRNGQVVVECSG